MIQRSINAWAHEQLVQEQCEICCSELASEANADVAEGYLRKHVDLNSTASRQSNRSMPDQGLLGIRLSLELYGADLLSSIIGLEKPNH